MDIYVEISHLAATLDRKAFSEQIRRLEDAGVTGVSVNDHLFATSDGVHRSDRTSPTCDPVATLGVVAGLSDRLGVQSVVLNSAFSHPALTVRHFAQLAQLVGGERVTMGLGAGWSAEEFDAIGYQMPPFGRRMDRLGEVLQIARSMLDNGRASFTGDHVSVRDLPLSPAVHEVPRLLVGGGSDRVMTLAGRYADILDLHGHPSRGKIAGATMAQARAGDVARRALTTVADLEERVGAVRAAERAAGRAPVAVSGSVFFTVYEDVDRAESALCAAWARIPDQSLRDSPYLLFGSPTQMAESLSERRERYGLARVTLQYDRGYPVPPPDPVRFCAEVLPLL
ncbi:LLM class flavin-dependent oxidoreductase [Nocardioides sp.]|uniref:LLM class flavin-dependent oxidoreductase n=1 Tax=Nocardioides sp. TaxID=35761 RepID=UPI0027370A8F|nr:LLM class flavin-dependent oxidoreductase [Nocardioides sp.]MDP3891839.1 LLM class flavin-dependent oxidoreductase [Nocardioides sp.]